MVSPSSGVVDVPDAYDGSMRVLLGLSLGGSLPGVSSCGAGSGRCRAGSCRARGSRSPSSRKRTRLRPLGAPAVSPGVVHAVGQRDRDLALLGDGQLRRSAPARRCRGSASLRKKNARVPPRGVADRAADQHPQRRLRVVVAELERREALAADLGHGRLARRELRLGRPLGLARLLLRRPSSWPSSLTGVAVGAAATADSSPPLSGRIISAIATPAPRNAAVASSPAIRRAQRDTAPLWRQPLAVALRLHLPRTGFHPARIVADARRRVNRA